MNQMVVAKFYQLLREANGYNKEHKKELRSRVVIPREYAEGMNADYMNNGKWYEIDEQATLEYYGKKSVSKVEDVQEDEEEKPKRKRRTKEEIEADKKK